MINLTNINILSARSAEKGSSGKLKARQPDGIERQKDDGQKQARFSLYLFRRVLYGVL